MTLLPWPIPPVVPIRALGTHGLYILPGCVNILLALAAPAAAGCTCCVLWTGAHEAVPASALAALDLFLAYGLIYYPLWPFMSANLGPAESPSIRAVRASSAIGMVVCLSVLIAKGLGRTMMVALHGFILLFWLQVGAWGASLAMRMQADGVLPLLPSQLTHLLNATPLELLPALRHILSADTVAKVISSIRALTSLLLLPDEHRDDAIALLPQGIAEALDEPIASQLPAVVTAMIAPWADCDALRLRHGVPYVSEPPPPPPPPSSRGQDGLSTPSSPTARSSDTTVDGDDSGPLNAPGQAGEGRQDCEYVPFAATGPLVQPAASQSQAGAPATLGEFLECRRRCCRRPLVSFPRSPATASSEQHVVSEAFVITFVF